MIWEEHLHSGYHEVRVWRAPAKMDTWEDRKTWIPAAGHVARAECPALAGVFMVKTARDNVGSWKIKSSKTLSRETLGILVVLMEPKQHCRHQG